MINKIRIFFQNNTIWLYLSKYVLISVFLALIVILIDTKFLNILNLIPSIFLTSVDLAKLILGTLAGALLTITTFTFSTIMVVLTMYSSNFSPRVVNNFLTDKISLKVLGIFVGGFFYCILALFFMRDNLSDYSVLSATIAVIYAGLCVIYFVIFVYRVASSIQASKLIKRVYDESAEIIDRSIAFRNDQKTLATYELGVFKGKMAITANRNGYIEAINFKKILTLLKALESRLIIRRDLGMFVSKNEEIATLYFNEIEIDDDLLDQIRSQFSIEDERFAYNDYRFSLEKITDIALRAISPGINDPNTAIYCIHILGILLSKLSEIKSQYIVIEDENAQSQIIIDNYHFDQDLYFTFYQIIHYGKHDLSVVIALFGALKTIRLTASDANFQLITDFSDYLFDACSPHYSLAMDLALLEKARRESLATII